MEKQRNKEVRILDDKEGSELFYSWMKELTLDQQNCIRIFLRSNDFKHE